MREAFATVWTLLDLKKNNEKLRKKNENLPSTFAEHKFDRTLRLGSRENGKQNGKKI